MYNFRIPDPLCHNQLIREFEWSLRYFYLKYGYIKIDKLDPDYQGTIY